MLELKKIKKVYETADLKQVALNSVSLNFRKCEFASILGQSGSGKTTLLNIIGGLDQYTSGDLIINGVSTKKYKDRDWDSYRNHRVGFIFQSYNLIQHQTILSNVELALTLSGVSKSERVKRAKRALKEVGLENHMNKKPSQLSGGQMQRVAIARALINDPDILLADEPTGALDTQTSKQIMELLKKVAKDKLVIMVTHNPELAEEYSTRIIRLSDGNIIDDTNPFKAGKSEEDKEKSKKKSKKTTMSFMTAISLSFNNLLTKKGRTILTSFAGSIGIIGIALILSLSNGFQNYIDKLQEDTLSSYPLTITNQTMDFGSLLVSMMEATKNEGVKEGNVRETQQFATMFSSISTNDLKSFKKTLEDDKTSVYKNVKSIEYIYSIDPNIYTKKDGEIIQINPNSIFSSMYGGSAMMSTFSSEASVFSKLSRKPEELKADYKIVKGRMPEKYNEAILMLPNENSIPDLMLYLLGLRDIEELYDIMTKVMSGEKVEIKNVPLEYSYDDLLNMELKLVNKPDLYKYNAKYKVYEDMSENKDYLNKVYNKSTNLKIVGIMCPKEGGGSMQTGIFYLPELIEHIINKAEKSDLVQKQLKNKDVDVFSNTRFDSKKKKTNLNFEDLISVDTKMLQSAFGMNITEADIANITGGYMGDIQQEIDNSYAKTKEELTTLVKEFLKFSIDKETEEQNLFGNKVKVIKREKASDLVTEFMSNKNYDEVTKVAFTMTLQTIYESLFMDLGVVPPTYKETTIMSETILNTVYETAAFSEGIDTAAAKINEGKLQMTILTKVGELSGKLIQTVATSFKVDSNKIAAAFKFDLGEDELKRLMGAMAGDNDGNASANLINLGYQDMDEPTAIAFRFKSFESKENFMKYIEKYNKKVLKNKENEKEINYTDTTGILMSSVKKIVDSVSYVLIAFVSIALIVSSIMIGIITYISVLERTKEIGILRAIGASKKNISSIFNAETFIIGFLSGIIGIGFTVIAIFPINKLIHSVTNNFNINAELPIIGGIVLIILSVILTLIGGLIPSRIASKKDPVEALRTE